MVVLEITEFIGRPACFRILERAHDDIRVACTVVLAIWVAGRERQNGVIRLMSPVEANSEQTLYQWLSTLTDQSNATWNAINDARRLAIQDPDPTHLSGQQLYETIQITETAIEKHLQVGDSIAFINSMFPGLPATLSYDEIRTYLSSPNEQDRQGMAAAHQRTMDRLKAAGYDPQDDELTFSKSGGR